MSETVHVEVVYALRDRQELVRLSVAPGTTVQQAIDMSGLFVRHPELSPAQNKLGIYGKLVKGDVVLRDGDRIEIYRPLLADPKEVRRKRAEEGKVMKKGGGPAEV